MALPSYISLASRPVSVVLCWLLVFQCLLSPAMAQDSTLEVAVLSVSNQVNDADYIAPWEIAVQVKDNQGNPIAGAAVVFQIPTDFGTFATGQTSAMVTTDANGIARVHGFRRGRQGAFFILVSASFNGQRGSVRIPQMNAARTTMPFINKAVLITAVAVSIGVGVIVGTRGDRHTTVSLGAGTVAPRP